MKKKSNLLIQENLQIHDAFDVKSLSMYRADIVRGRIEITGASFVQIDQRMGSLHEHFLSFCIYFLNISYSLFLIRGFCQCRKSECPLGF